MGVLREENKGEARAREKIFTNQRREYDKAVQKIGNLIDLRAAGEITEEEFSSRKKAHTKEKMRLEELLNDTSGRVDDWLETAEKYFSFAERAERIFAEGSLETKKEVLSALGSNLTLKDKKLSVSLPKPLELIESVAQEVRSINERFEPQKTQVGPGLLEEKYSHSPTLLPQHYINIPLFFNREYMQQMAQRLALIKLMIRMEAVETMH